MTNEIKRAIVIFVLALVCFISGFSCGYDYQSERLDRLQTRLDTAEEQQQETAGNIGKAESGVDDAKETTERIEDSVDESRRVEQSTSEILDRIEERIEKVEAENSQR
jgi:septal ring factor EnvC (AmiA/AmiB activator)